MPNDPSAPTAGNQPVESLSASLESLAKSHDLTKGISIGDLFDAFGTKGFGILMALLALPSALPIPAPGYSTPFGILLAILGFQLFRGKREPVLPNWARNRIVPSFLATAMGTRGAGIARFIEKFLHPRLMWVQNRAGFSFLSLVIIFMGGLMILPIPLTNTVPAFVILLIAVGMIERDGLFLLGAMILSFFALVLYIFVIWLVVKVIMDTGFDMDAINAEAEELKDAIKGFVKRILGRSES